MDASFEALVAETLPGLRRYARALTGDPDLAEDLVQDALVRVAGAWRRVRVDENPAGYLRTVLFRTYVSWWRIRRRRGVPLLLLDDQIADRDRFGPAEARVVLRSVLRTLPRLQQAVLVASYLDDRPDEEIAELIGRAPATVRSLRRRGLAALRTALADSDASLRPGGGSPPTAKAPVHTPALRPTETKRS